MEDRSRAYLAQVCKGQVCEGKRHLSNEKGVRWKTEDAEKALKAFSAHARFSGSLSSAQRRHLQRGHRGVRQCRRVAASHGRFGLHERPGFGVLETNAFRLSH